MVKMNDGLKILLEKQRLEQELASLQEVAADLLKDCELLACALVKTPAFTDWLLEQDVSSSHMSKPSLTGSKGSSVESADDLTLALRFAWRTR